MLSVADSCGFRHETCILIQAWNVTGSRQQQQNTTESPSKVTLHSKRQLRSQRPEPFWTAIRNGRRQWTRIVVKFSVLSTRWPTSKPSNGFFGDIGVEMDGTAIVGL